MDSFRSPGQRHNHSHPARGRFADADGTWNSTIQYTAFGEIRLTRGITPTKYRYTGQLAQAEMGLDYYVARFYDPVLGHFTSADSIVPDPGKASGFDRYAYVSNNPIRYNDPSGHVMAGECGEGRGCEKREKKTTNEQSKLNISSTNSDNKTRQTVSLMKPILLKGGVGSTNYSIRVEESWTGFSFSGESADIRTAGFVSLIDLGGNTGVWLRDNTNLMELMGNVPDAYGSVIFESTGNSWRIVSANVLNNSYERLMIKSIILNNIAVHDNSVTQKNFLFPYKNGYQPQDYGIIESNNGANINLSQSQSFSTNLAQIQVFIKSESNRYGTLSTYVGRNLPKGIYYEK
jgi:RHS repeat-associated protein